MRVFALTGSIASGKSTVAEHWSKQGLPVISADDLARDAVVPGSEGLSEIVKAFGIGVLAADGSLDRKQLAKHVFGHAEQLAQLNRIVHPQVRQLSAKRFAELAAKGSRLACYELPLLYESGLEKLFSPVVVVAVAPEVQLERLIGKRDMTHEEARKRLSSQLPSAEKAERADYVINNNADIEETLRQADAVLDSILEREGLSRSDLRASTET